MTLQAELVWDAKATLGEGPGWDEESQTLFWVDILEKALHTWHPSTGEKRTLHVAEYIGAAAPRASGGWIAAMQNGLYFLDQSGEAKSIVDPERDRPHNRFNDGKCDPAGRFWAGTMEMKAKNPTGSLYCLHADGTLRKTVEHVTISNGLAWSPDYRTMYFIDTPTKSVFAFDYNLETGTIENRRTAIRIPEGEGNPDGMTIDEEGKLWIAFWGGYQVARWDPVSGEKLASVSLPVSQVTSCAFGGPSLDELYITTASVGLDENQRAEEPAAGGVFRVKTGIRGAATFRFEG